MSFEDEVLEQLVKEAEEKGIGIGVTLCVNGLIITGNVIPSKTYFDKMFDNFDEKSITTDDPAERELALTYLSNQFVPKVGRSSEEQDNPKYIHLNNVVMYPSDSSHPFVANVWRGKLSSVDGFSLGYAYWESKEVVEDK